MLQPAQSAKGFAMKLAAMPCLRATALTARFSSTPWSRGELGVRDVMQVDLELAGRELLERRAGRDVLRLAGLEQVGEEGIDLLDVLHAAVLRAVLDRARAGNAARPAASATSVFVSSR